MDYFDFELEIGTASANAYPVTVIRSPTGEAHETLRLPFDDQTLSTQLSTLQQALQMGSQSLATGEQAIQGFGQALFGALFTGQVRDLYVASRTEAESQGKGLRVKLRLQPPELAALPWEFLYDADQGQYLCLSDKTPLVRYVELPAPCQPLSVAPPLSILGLTASPKDLPELDVAREQQRINTALAPLQSKGLAQITWLTGHTWEDLQQALLAGPWHIFHFIGHGGFDANTHEGVIALEDKAGQSHYLSANQLGMLLADHPTLRLVVLNSCKGARSGTRESFSSTASQVVRHGIPAVVANQYDISDEAAIALSRTFYAALAAGMPVDTALGEARKAISLGGGQSLEWGTPVLHLHAPDGVLFHLTPPADLAVNIRQATPSPAGPPPARSAVTSSVQASPLSIQEPLASSLVRIRTTNGRVVGAGFLVGARQILTCAHVISQALELADGAVDLPQAVVSLDFPFASPRMLFTAKVVLWRPPLADGSDDIAGLELQGEPPAGVETVRFAEAADVWEHPFRAFGFPAGYDDGVWATGRLLGRQATDWIVIEDVKAQGFAVAPGFSGTPVWDTQLEGVVGMVVAASQPADTKAAFVIPLDVLVAAWPPLEPITRQRIFLSAAPADTAFADRLRTDLEARDIVVWTEQHTPDSGQTTKEESIRQAIRAAQAVVLVVSSQTRSSRTVKEHLRLADLYSRRLILVWIGAEPAQPQRYGWRETIVVDVHNTPYKVALETIEANLDRHRSISTMLGSAHTIPEEEQKEPRNPYKGLRAFTANDAGDFFGRERLVDELIKGVEKLLGPEQATTENGRLLTILGPSGSGKSSVVMAGPLPRLQHGDLPGSETWVYLEPMVPGKHPIEALGQALARHFPQRSFTSIREDLSDDATRGLHILATQLVKQRGSNVVLLVDQFEELFTQTESEEERQRFIDLLLTATTEPRGPLLVLLTLRADFSHYLMQYPKLYRLVKAHEKPLFPMEVDDLRATVEHPAALPDVQLTFEGNLVGDLLFEIQGQVGALPLLQFTLAQLFERRSGHRLTLSAYREIGGVKGALSRHAESTYAALPSEEHRKLARTLFVRLIEPGATEQDTTRRRAALAEFTLVDAPQTRLMRETIDSFIAARLLTANEVAETTTIEVSHEAVIREWKRLADWMHEARQDIPLQQAISEDATEWERRGKPIDRLYRGTQLSEAQAWTERSTPSRDEVTFLEASAAERQKQETEEQSRQARELALQRRVVSRQRLLVFALSIFLVIVTLAGALAEANFLQANTQRQQANRQAQIAASRALAAQANYALVQNQLDRALLLSVKANQTYDTYDARDSLLSALEYSPRLLAILDRGSSGGHNSTLTISPDGQTLTDLETNLSWDIKTRKRHIPPFSLHFNQHEGYDGLVVSPNGQVVAATSSTGLWVQHIKTGTVTQLEGDIQGRPSYAYTFPTVAFSPDGKTLASGRCVTYTGVSGGSTCTQVRVLLWDVSSGKPTSQLLIGQTSIVISMTFSPNGKILALSNMDGAVQLWNLASKRLSDQFSIGHAQDLGADFSQQRESLAFNPESKLLAAGSTDGTITLWDVVARKPFGLPFVGHAGAVEQLAFSPDGKLLVSGSADKTLRLWHLAMPFLPFDPYSRPLVGHTGGILSVVFSPDGKLLASSDTSGTILLWNLAADSSIKQQLEYPSDVHSMVFSSDGKMIIAGDDKGKIILREAATGTLLATFDATMDPTGIPSGQPLEDGPLTIESLVLNSDRHTLAAGRFDGMIFLWDMGTKRPLIHFRRETRLKSVVFSPDGHLLASNYQNGTILLWDVATGKVLHQLTHRTGSPEDPNSPRGQMSTIAFSQDGKLLASGDNKTVVFWDVATGKRHGQPLTGHTEDVKGVAFSPDGKTMASIDFDSTIILWDLETGKPISQPLLNFDLDTGQQTIFNAGFTFSQDGTLLASGGFYTVTVWDVTRRELIAHAFQEDKDIFGQSMVVRGVTFSPNGQRLSVIFTQYGPGRISQWNINRASWQTLACSIANRNFTVSEWSQFVGQGAYQKVCPNLPVDEAVTRGELQQADTDAEQGRIQDAVALYRQTTQEAAQIANADINNSVCWDGSIHQFAKVVLPACELAVALEPDSGDFHDSRGLARALTGDTQGAIDDFKFFVQWATDFLNSGGTFGPGVQESYKQRIHERTAWIQELEAGRNPFDAKTLKALQNE